MKSKMQKIQILFLILFSTHVAAQNIIVAKDGSGDFKTIHEAINVVTDNQTETTIIHVKNGIYNEVVIIPLHKNNIQIIGEDKEKTIITFDNYSGKVHPISNVKFGTSTSHTVLVQGDNITFKNITIKNSWCDKGQAVALHVTGDKFFIVNSNILGCQDTLYTASKGSAQYYLNCVIEGTTDFIFGPAIAVFENCVIKSKKDSFITAASTPENQEFGYVFLNCDLVADKGISKVFLGRPWRPFAKTVFVKCKMESHILAEGWNPWLDDRFPNKDKTAYYAEYKSKGEGANASNRVAWSHQLTKKEISKYTLENIFRDHKNWISIIKSL